jgi:CoA:oxalate CoA-transferase|tara:strand:- start:694 stop:1848 length:1155 start_codon:yes stop_codon:yes gene_type:complete
MKEQSPLSGIIILDLTRVLAGPYCTMILSDLGARVIKVENPETGDDAREIGPFIKGKSAYFMSLNHGKESIALDLKKKEDRIVFEKLLSVSDVLVENFKPQTLKKLNYGWKALHKKYPKLIYATISGFGHSGPYKNRPSYDLIAQSMGGIVSLTGQPKSPPVRAGASIGDIAAGLFATIGICSALYKNKGKKSGVHIDIGMMDCQLALLENAISRYSATLKIPTPIGARHPTITPFDAFKSKDSYLVIAAGNNKLFKKFCLAIRRKDLLGSPLFINNEKRTQNIKVLYKEINKEIKKKISRKWIEIFVKSGVPAAPINNIKQLFSDPQMKERNMIVQMSEPQIGRIKIAGNPIKISGISDPKNRKSSPRLNQNRKKILKELKLI